MRYEKELFIPKEEVKRINHYLHDEPADAADCLGEDVTIVYTAAFDNGLELDIKSFPPCDFWWKLSEDGCTQRKPKSCGILEGVKFSVSMGKNLL